MAGLLPDGDDNFVEQQRDKVETEITRWQPENWNEDHQESVWWAFTLTRRDGQGYDSSTNELQPDKRKAVREYIQFGDVVEIDGVLVDLLAVNIQYHCMWKSCKSTGQYCCKKPLCTGHTTESELIQKEAGREFIDKYTNEERIARIRQGNTHTVKLNAQKEVDDICVFGEDRTGEDPDTGEEYHFNHCNLHEAAYEEDIPLHYVHSIGSSLFPADLLIVDDKFFITTAHPRAVEHGVSRWVGEPYESICVKHGDKKDIPILRHPDFDGMYADILGRDTLDQIQQEAYGASGPIEPEIKSGWIQSTERGLDEVRNSCRSCEGEGCSKCDGRGYFRRWEDGN